MADLIGDVIGTGSESYNNIDETNKVIDSQDHRSLRGTISKGFGIISLYIILLNTVKRNGLRKSIFDPDNKSFGEFSILLILRTLFLETVVVPLIVFGISTITTVWMQRRLSKDQRICRAATWNIARNFGCHVYDTINPPSSTGIAPLPVVKNANDFVKPRILYAIRSFISERHGLYHTYKSGELNFGIFEEWLKNDNYENVSFDRGLIKTTGGRIQGSKLVRRLDEYNDRLRQLMDIYSSENAARKKAEELLQKLKNRLKIDRMPLDQLQKEIPETEGEAKEDRESSHEYYFPTITEHKKMVADNNINDLKEELKNLKLAIKEGPSTEISELEKKIESATAIKSLEKSREKSLNRREAIETELKKHMEVINAQQSSEKLMLEREKKEKSLDLQNIEASLTYVSTSINRVIKQQHELGKNDDEEDPGDIYERIRKDSVSYIPFFPMKDSKDLAEDKEALENRKKKLEEEKKRLKVEIEGIGTELKKMKAKEIDWVNLKKLDNELLEAVTKLQENPENSKLKEDSEMKRLKIERNDKNIESKFITFENLKEFCKALRKNSELRNKPYNDPEKKKFWHSWFGFLKGVPLLRNLATSKSLKYGTVYYRVRRTAGSILLGEREAARCTSRSIWGGLSNILVSSLVLFVAISIKVLIEAGITVSSTINVTELVTQGTPNLGTSSWDCARYDEKNMYLYSYNTSNSECLWESRNERVFLNPKETKLQLTWNESATNTWANSNGAPGVWMADGKYPCKTNRVSQSILRNGLQNPKANFGGFLRVCGSSESNKIFLLTDKIEYTDAVYKQEFSTVENEMNATVYKSGWIGNDEVLTRERNCCRRVRRGPNSCMVTFNNCFY